ncbi:hypothetical protein RB598_002587 [Gaeumannomyces tritici]
MFVDFASRALQLPTGSRNSEIGPQPRQRLNVQTPRRPHDSDILRQPIPTNRLKQIANDACHDAIGSAEFYDHAKTEQWNSQIINSILKAVIAESQPSGGSTPFKFAVNSTIVQHLVPTSKLNKPTGGAAASEESSTTATSTDGKPHVGRRGMHSATGAYWNDKTDGMWTFKYEGDESKGMDVIVMLVWIGI